VKAAELCRGDDVLDIAPVIEAGFRLWIAFIDI
jgi:hypothetical protein